MRKPSFKVVLLIALLLWSLKELSDPYIQSYMDSLWESLPEEPQKPNKQYDYDVIKNDLTYYFLKFLQRMFITSYILVILFSGRK